MVDRITLSDTAQHLARATASLASEPVVNSQRVAEIRQALIEGSYRIDPVQIAEKFQSFSIRLH
jgi:negative regulator of flagellin synthesis FlgM